MVLSFRVAVLVVSGRTRCRCRAAPFEHQHSKTAELRQEENGKNFFARNGGYSESGWNRCVSFFATVCVADIADSIRG
ncbi:hypothetical protein HRbin36_02482 [bacterium HR36]|nr:hypothetical protein HRbin36_02482 [bacterium HR36]